LQGIPNSGLAVVPGPGDEPVSIKGKILDRDRFLGMLKEYYRLRGWDESTGLPRAEKLAALGMDGVASAF